MNNIVIWVLTGFLDIAFQPKTQQFSDEVEFAEKILMTKNPNVNTSTNVDTIVHAPSEERIKAGENKQPAWCYYKNQTINDENYGKLYNWHSVIDSRGIAPEGWHILNLDEFDEFFNGFNSPLDNTIGFNLKWNNMSYEHKSYCKKIAGGDYIDDKLTVTEKIMGNIIAEPTLVPVVNVPEELKYIDFQDIDFDMAIKKSYESNKPIFLLFGMDTNEETKTVLLKLESEQKTINSLNNNYIPLYYIVDRYKTSKYVAAAGPLGVTSYPTIAIVKGTNDPTIKDQISGQRINTIKDSIEIVTVEDRIMDNLDNIKNLLN